MGTRCLTVFNDNSGKEIGVLYRQMDGYPEAHGKELAEFCSGVEIVNGIRFDVEGRIANGMPCLAAQIVAYFKKDDVGGFYLYATGTRDVWGEEPSIKVERHGKVIFDGAASDLSIAIKNGDLEDDE